MNNYIKKSLRVELLKLKGLGLHWFGLLLAGIFPISFLIYRSLKSGEEVGYDLDKSIFGYYVSSHEGHFLGLFLYLFIIIATVRVAQTDHKSGGWTLLETQPLSKLSIYLGKFLAVTLLVWGIILLFYFFSLLASGIEYLLQPRPLMPFRLDIDIWLPLMFRQMLYILGLISVQVMLSVLIPGFIWPIVVAFGGVILNVFSLLEDRYFDYIVYNTYRTSNNVEWGSLTNSYFIYSDYLNLFWAVFFFIIGYVLYAKKGIQNYFKKFEKWKPILFIIVSTGIFFWLSSKKEYHREGEITTISGEIVAERMPKKIRLFQDNYDRVVQVAMVQDGKFEFKLSGKIDLGQYSLRTAQSMAEFPLSSGDHIEIKFVETKTSSNHSQAGTRVADAKFLASQPYMSSFFIEMQEKSFSHTPSEFYKKAEKDYSEYLKLLETYRTKENIGLSQDLRQNLAQIYATKMLVALKEYQRMVDTSQPVPSDFLTELNTRLKNPGSFYLGSEDYGKYRLASLGFDKDKNIDRVLALKNPVERDALLRYQALVQLEETSSHEERERILNQTLPQIKDPNLKNYLLKRLQVLRSQQRGMPMPEVHMEDESGREHTLSDFRGKYVVIDLWATWCGPCKETAPAFERYARHYSYDDKIAFVSISIDEDKSKWKMDLKGKKSNVHHFWLRNPEVMQTLGVEGVPRFIMLDPQGKILNADMPRPNEYSFEKFLESTIGKASTGLNINI